MFIVRLGFFPPGQLGLRLRKQLHDNFTIVFHNTKKRRKDNIPLFEVLLLTLSSLLAAIGRQRIQFYVDIHWNVFRYAWTRNWYSSQFRCSLTYQTVTIQDVAVLRIAFFTSDQQKKYISIKLRPNAIICVFYADGVRGVVEQFGLQNSTVRVWPRKGLLWELVFDS
jgi:hypothetical protein